jgi:peptide/nickel transport system substrate-binding protein
MEAFMPMRSRVSCAVAVLIVMMGLAVPLSGGSASAASSSRTLKMAFSYDPGSLDPDVFYDGEGANITLSTYEGLVQYAGNSTSTIVPLLATSWTTSADALTYTFQLRPGVKFTDGSPVTSTTWKDEIQRRKTLNQGSAYMVADIANVGTPSPSTLVITLDHPVSAFMDFLASPYSIKAVNPAVTAAHDVKGDLGMAYLADHSAGTGPYVLSSATPGQSYQLTTNRSYWGPKPYFNTVQFSLVPSFTTQELMLQHGQLDLVYHGIPSTDLGKYSGGSFQVKQFPSIVRLNLWVNPNVAPFNNPVVRAALATAINRASIIKTVYGKTASTATQMFTTLALPAGLGTFNPTYNPSALKTLAPSIKSVKIDLAYTTDDSLNAQVAQLIQTELSADGLNVTTRGVTQQTTFAWPTQPQGRSSMLILPANPDDANASSWSTLFYANNGGLSYFTPTNVTSADQLVQQGLQATSPTTATALYAQAANAYRATGDFIPLADEREVTVARSGICGWQHDFTTLWAIRLQSLKAC